MNKFKYLCNAPHCNCFSAVEYTKNGVQMLNIKDKNGNSIDDSLESFDKLVVQYLKYKGENK